jgi:TolB-like protein
MRSCLLLLAAAISLLGQTRIAVLPFRNMDGDLRYNLWCYRFADSVAAFLAEALQHSDTLRQRYVLVSRDTLEQVLGELNLDPTTPQYDSDMWKAAQLLQAEKVLTGNFNLLPGKILLNAYLYDVRTKKAEAAVRNLYRSEDRADELSRLIVDRLLPQLYGP